MNKHDFIDVWVDGFSIPGTSTRWPAAYIGTYYAHSLRQAVIDAMNKGQLYDKQVNLANLTYWGLKIRDQNIDNYSGTPW